MAMDKIITTDQQKSIENLLKTFPAIIAGYLFGSRVKGRSLPTSDLDLGLVCFKKEGFSPLELAVNLDRLNLPYNLDSVVVDLEDDPLLLIQIINGEVVYQKSLRERIVLETRILHFYEDDQHLMAIKKYYLDKSFKEGIYAH